MDALGESGPVDALLEPRSRPGRAAALAEAAGAPDAGAGQTEPGRSFLPDWDAGSGSEEARKNVGMASGEATKPPRSLCGGAKECRQGITSVPQGSRLNGKPVFKEHGRRWLAPNTPSYFFPVCC